MCSSDLAVGRIGVEQYRVRPRAANGASSEDDGEEKAAHEDHNLTRKAAGFPRGPSSAHLFRGTNLSWGAGSRDSPEAAPVSGISIQRFMPFSHSCTTGK